jgi:hypothetical protein
VAELAADRFFDGFRSRAKVIRQISQAVTSVESVR